MRPEADGLAMGVDIGGTWVEAVVADGRHRIIGRARHGTDADGPARVLAVTHAAIEEAMSASGISPGDLSGIGVGVPGQVEQATGVVRLAMNLNIDSEGFPIGPPIAERYGVRTTVENDVRAAAVGAYDYLSPRHPELGTLAYLSIGTGISAGLVVDGRVHRGRDGMAGEIGHVVVDPGGPLCRCGLSGCLEAVAAGPAIQRLWPEGAGRPVDDLFRAASGNGQAAHAAEVLTGHFTQAVQWLAAGYGADLVVLGGGIGSAGGSLLAAIRRRLAAHAEASDVARRVAPPERVTAMPAGFPTGAIGAAALARRRSPAGTEGEGQGEEGGTP